MSNLLSLFNNFLTLIKSFFNSVISIFDYIVSIFKTLWYALTSLLTSSFELVKEVAEGSLFGYLFDGFSNLSFFIGVPATIFISSLFLVVVLRIGISFVFKLFRLNLDYNSMKTWSRSTRLK